VAILELLAIRRSILPKFTAVSHSNYSRRNAKLPNQDTSRHSFAVPVVMRFSLRYYLLLRG
jgi:hypothetical protein